MFSCFSFPNSVVENKFHLGNIFLLLNKITTIYQIKWLAVEQPIWWMNNQTEWLEFEILIKSMKWVSNSFLKIFFFWSCYDKKLSCIFLCLKIYKMDLLYKTISNSKTDWSTRKTYWIFFKKLRSESFGLVLFLSPDYLH